MALAAGWGIVGLLVLFSISRGFCSVSMKDVQGKCIPKSRRGRLTGLSATLSGALTFGLTLLIFRGDSDPSVLFYSALLAGAGCGLVGGRADVFCPWMNIPVPARAGSNALREAWNSLSLLKDDAPFRRFVITRALLMASSLASPFLVFAGERAIQPGVAAGEFSCWRRAWPVR